MSCEALDEEPGIAVLAIMLTSGVRIDAIVENLRLVENALGLDFLDYQHSEATLPNVQRALQERNRPTCEPSAVSRIQLIAESYGLTAL